MNNTPRNYTFLEAIREDFTTKYPPSRLEAARAYELEKSFGPTLSSIIHHYNTHPNAGSTKTKVVALTAHVEDLKNVIGDNIQLMLRREDCIESLASKATELEGQARVFRKQTTQVKQKVKKKYHKMFFIQCVLLSGIVALLGMTVWAVLSRVNSKS
jgi:vesicle-associated membrane protein 7